MEQSPKTVLSTRPSFPYDAPLESAFHPRLTVGLANRCALIIIYMARLNRLAVLSLFAGLMHAPTGPTPTPRYPNSPTETPAKTQRATTGFDYERRDVMISMRD